MFKRIAAAFAAILMLVAVGLSACANNSKELAATPAASLPKHDTSALTYTADAHGTVRMIGGWYHADNEIETEDGNIWGVNTESISQWDFLLVWFDDMNTPEVEDDQIIEIWKGVYD